MKSIKAPELSEDDVEFDEAFLLQVDRAMLLSKQRDPFRMDQVARAAEEEMRIAHLTAAQDPERSRYRDAQEAWIAEG